MTLLTLLKATGGGGVTASVVGVTRTPSDGTDATGASLALTIPGGTAIDDYAAIIVELWDSTATNPTLTYPSGFSQIVNYVSTTDGFQKLKVAIKPLTAADSGTYSVSGFASHFRQGHVAILRGIDLTTALDVAVNLAQNASGTTLPANSITTVTNGCLLMRVIANENTCTGLPDTGYTEQADSNYTKTNTKIQTTAGTDTPSGGSFSASTLKLGALIAFRPASGGGGVTGSASLTVTATTTATGATSAGASAAISAAVSVAGAAGLSGGSTRPITAGVTVSGASTGSAALAVTAGVTAAGLTSGANAASLAVTTTVAAAGSVSGGAARSVTATVTATGNVASSSGAALSVTSTITASSGGGVSSGAALTLTAAITTAGVVGKNTGGSLPVTVTATAAGGASGATAATFTAAITAAGSTGAASFNGAADRSIVVTVTTAGVVGRSTSATEPVTVSIAATGSVNLQRSATLIASAVVLAAGLARGADVPARSAPAVGKRTGDAAAVSAENVALSAVSERANSSSTIR